MHTIDEIRRMRLRELAKEFGSQKALAEKIQKTPGQLSALINGAKDSKTGRPRGMHDDTARDIEEKCGKPRGWLDSASNGSITDRLSALDSQDIEKILESLELIGPNHLGEAALMLSVYAERVAALKEKSDDKE